MQKPQKGRTLVFSARGLNFSGRKTSILVANQLLRAWPSEESLLLYLLAPFLPVTIYAKILSLGSRGWNQ